MSASPTGPRGQRIVYAFSIIESDGMCELPRVALPTAEEARAAAVSFLADRVVSEADAADMLDWTEDIERRDGKYPAFEAPTKYGRTVRVYPIEVMDDEP